MSLFAAAILAVRKSPLRVPRRFVQCDKIVWMKMSKNARRWILHDDRLLVRTPQGCRHDVLLPRQKDARVLLLTVLILSTFSCRHCSIRLDFLHEIARAFEPKLTRTCRCVPCSTRSSFFHLFFFDDLTTSICYFSNAKIAHVWQRCGALVQKLDKIH